MAQPGCAVAETVPFRLSRLGWPRKQRVPHVWYCLEMGRGPQTHVFQNSIQNFKTIVSQCRVASKPSAVWVPLVQGDDRCGPGITSLESSPYLWWQPWSTGHSTCLGGHSCLLTEEAERLVGCALSPGEYDSLWSTTVNLCVLKGNFLFVAES